MDGGGPIPSANSLRGTLYDPRFEHDSCGVGFVAEVDGVASRRPIELAIGALERLAHRGAVDTDGPDATGDGTGVLIQIPFQLIGDDVGDQRIADARLGELGVGMLFVPRDHDMDALRHAFAACAAEIGLDVLAWRDVPVCPDEIGRIARQSRPIVVQVVIAPRDPAVFGDDLDRKLLRLRRALRRDHRGDTGIWHGVYTASMSSRTIVYKGMLVAGQLARFYPDLTDQRTRTAIAVFHQRFSTNTFPSWERAQPMRMLAHNGEINTLDGNLAWMQARESNLGSGAFGPDASAWLRPVVDNTSSDSGVLDNVLELLRLGGRSLPHSMSMLIPPAWEHARDMPAERRAFHAFHAGMMEPWDGPAAVVFTDGRTVGACLDRAGLRPARWLRTDDGLVALASEAGSVPVDPRRVVHRGKLGPGQMLVIDTRRGAIVRDERLMEQLGAMRDWQHVLSQRRTRVNDTTRDPIDIPDADDVLHRQRAAGYSSEELTVVMRTMLTDASEPLGSMGDDTPLAVLARHDRPITGYLRQRFAEVSNPPIDPLRERTSMTLRQLVGPRQPVLDTEPATDVLIELRSPILDAPARRELLRCCGGIGTDTALIDVNVQLHDLDTPGALRLAILRICDTAERAAAGGATLLELSDTSNAPASEGPLVAVPSLLVVGAVHQRLVAAGHRTQVTLLVSCDDIRDVHDVACLIGHGAELVYPRLALDTVASIASQPHARAKLDIEPRAAQRNYVHALEQGLLKVMSKMGIATIDAYCAGQIFEIIGLADDVVDTCFSGTLSRLGGDTLDDIAARLTRRARAALDASSTDTLPSDGFYKYKRDGEPHGFALPTVKQLHAAVSVPDALGTGWDAARSVYREFADRVVESPPIELRDLLAIIGIGREPVHVDDVEPARAILCRFSTGAVSHGSISTEAHETMAIAMNRVGGMSNSGEGGEAAQRFGTARNSAIKQIASARFGVTPAYLQSARELQIKIAQGAKPGEGGHLPGHKVTAEIAAIRHTVEGRSLISPPPHHDIYSIEDLAQLIADLRAAAPLAQISVKLVTQSGVGTIAAGVAKARADVIVLAGHSGGTGAAPLSSIKHAGGPWELGLAETQQVLRANNLRGRVRLRVDGGLRTGRDVVVAALLGADEMSFGTAALVAEGCLMARTCHTNNCPVGIATQRADLRAKYPGTPERVMTYMTLVAEEVRELLAQLGVRSLRDIVGRVDALGQRLDRAAGGDGAGAAPRLDLSAVLAEPDVPDDWDRRHTTTLRFAHEDETLDRALTAELWPRLEAAADGETIVHSAPIGNIDRSVGSGIGGVLARPPLEAARVPSARIDLTFTGSAGASFGAFTGPELTLRLIGEANDYVAKGLAGATVVVQPPPGSAMARDSSEQYVLGNTCLYGATSGLLLAAGRAGERFAVRNSGADAVVEGAGDHACEYMTDGDVVVLGRIGRNFGAGMTGGRAFVVDAGQSLEHHINSTYVDITQPDPAALARFWQLVEAHAADTKSAHAASLLAARETVTRGVRLIVPRA